MLWESEPFYNKSKLYIQQCEPLRPEDRFHVFWHLLAYELLVKACIALKAKPLLAAEGRNGHHLLFAIGIETTKTLPLQRPLNELLELLKFVVPGFTEEDYKKSLAWINFRNEELHTASDRLTDFAESGWQGDYYRITKNLLSYLGKTVSEYYGKDRVATIEKVINELNSAVISEVKKEISASQTYYAKLTESEKEAIRKGFQRSPRSKNAKCPSCNEECVTITGELIQTTDPEIRDGDLYTISKYLPSHLKCHVCRLELNGFSAINVAGLGAEFSIREYIDPIEQFNIDIEEEYSSRYADQLHHDEYMDE